MAHVLPVALLALLLIAPPGAALLMGQFEGNDGGWVMVVAPLGTREFDVTVTRNEVGNHFAEGEYDFIEGRSPASNEDLLDLGQETVRIQGTPAGAVAIDAGPSTGGAATATWQVGCNTCAPSTQNASYVFFWAGLWGTWTATVGSSASTVIATAGNTTWYLRADEFPEGPAVRAGAAIAGVSVASTSFTREWRGALLGEFRGASALANLSMSDPSGARRACDCQFQSLTPTLGPVTFQASGIASDPAASVHLLAIDVMS